MKTIIAIGGYPRSGKQQPISEPVLTPTGWTPIGKIRPGDFVIGSKGLPVEVVAIHPQTDRRVFSVKFTDDSEVRCGAEHLWKVETIRQRGKNRKYGGDRHMVMPTEDIIDIGVRTRPSPSHQRDNLCGYKFYLPDYQPVHEGKNFPHAYALGYILGDGGFSGGLLTVSCHEQVKSKLAQELYPSLGLSTQCRYTSDKGVQFTYSWKNIASVLQKYRNSGLSHEKQLLDDWTNWDYESRFSLLSGLMDSDGTAQPLGKGTGTSFCSTNMELIYLVRDLTRSLGGVAMQEPSYDSRDYYKSGVCGTLAVMLPKSPFRLREYEPSLTYYPSVKIVDIKQLEYDEDSVCIEVNADDHLYTTANYKLTHNSSSLKLLQGQGIPTFSTSVLLDRFIVALETTFGVPIPTTVEERRKHKIAAAEEVLVPIFSRQVFANQAGKDLMECESELVVVETIGGEEWKELQKAIAAQSMALGKNYQIYKFNVTRKSQLTGVDIRKPLERAYEVQNNGTLEQLDNKWKFITALMGYDGNSTKLANTGRLLVSQLLTDDTITSEEQLRDHIQSALNHA